MSSTSEKIIFMPYCQVTLGKEKDGVRFRIWVEHGTVWGYHRSLYATEAIFENDKIALKYFIETAVHKALELYELEKEKRSQDESTT